MNAPLHYDQIGPQVAVLTLNRPESRNAINAQITLEIEAAVEAIEADKNIRVGIITGAGGQAFCAGADLKEVAAGGLPAMFTAGGFAGFTHAKRRKPWIAAVNGAALAGGCEIALSCDMIVASSNAAFGLPEVCRGLIASAGGLYRLPRMLPRKLAMEMIVTGRPIDAATAHHHGMVNRVVSPEQALKAAIDLAEEICANAPLAVLESLAIARKAFDATDEWLFEQGSVAQQQLQQTDDYHEGALAFVERRRPCWAGR